MTTNKDSVSKEEIEKNIYHKASIDVFQSINSTNLFLKEESKNSLFSKRVIIANSQTNGRGRLGRTFHSPDGGGIYMSLLLRPDEYTDVSMLTAYTAVVVCKTLEEVSGKTFGIKWVNDILKNNKKVCGILAESGTEDGRLSYIVVGIGINVYPPKGGFEKDIENIAGSIFEDEIPNKRNEIISKIINRFYDYDPKNIDFLLYYRDKSTVLGKEINVLKRDEVKKAKALEINDSCNLLVEYENKEKEYLSFGEISVRNI